MITKINLTQQSLRQIWRLPHDNSNSADTAHQPQWTKTQQCHRYSLPTELEQGPLVNSSNTRQPRRIVTGFHDHNKSINLRVVSKHNHNNKR